MRMWMIKPDLLCNKHLVGEHGEIHKAVGNLRNTGKWTNSLIERGFLEPQNFKKRHDKLAIEMVQRGMNHKSPLDLKGVDLAVGEVDTKRSIRDLIERCELCKKRIKNTKTFINS